MGLGKIGMFLEAKNKFLLDGCRFQPVIDRRDLLHQLLTLEKRVGECRLWSEGSVLLVTFVHEC